MKIGYFGTPDYSARLLKSLHEAGHEIVYTITNPDRPAGRGKQMIQSPVKEFSVNKNIPCFLFDSLKENEAYNTLREYETDINVVFAYGMIIPLSIINIPLYKTVNLHGSLLPKFRGASPIQSVLLEGNDETGVTLQYINERMDAGNILKQKTIPIQKEDNYATLLEKIVVEGGRLLLALLSGKPDGILYESSPQTEIDATYCKKITNFDRKILLSKNADQIWNQVRALTPIQPPYLLFRDKKIFLHMVAPVEDPGLEEARPGGLIIVDRNKLILQCGNKTYLEILELQAESKQKSAVKDFINGYRITKGECFREG